MSITIFIKSGALVSINTYNKMVNKHDKKTKEMGLKPHIIGLDNIVLSTEESHILKPSGSLIGEPDNLMFDPTTHTLYHIEYKCRDTDSQSKKARYQLKRNSLILQAMFEDWVVIDLYIHDDYEVERI